MQVAATEDLLRSAGPPLKRGSGAGRSGFVIPSATLGLFLWTLPARALPWGDLSNDPDQLEPPPHGPHDEDAPLPPREPLSPGEPEHEEPPDDGNTIDDGEQADIGSDEKRPRPDYDGRPSRSTFGDVALWVPRIILSPLYFVSEYVVRRPLGAFVTLAERKHWPSIVVDFFTFGPRNNAGIVPTGLVDFGFRPSGGLYFFWNDILRRGNDLRLRGATGGMDWWLLEGAYHKDLGEEERLSLRGQLEIRPDRLFHGLGPESREAQARYRIERFEGAVGYRHPLLESGWFSAFIGVRDVSFDPDTTCCDDPSVADAIAQGQLSPPPGLDEGYTVLRQGITVDLDTRPERYRNDRPRGVDWPLRPESGVNLELRAEHSGGLTGRARPAAAERSRLEWITYGATAGGFADITGHRRTVGLELIADFADPLPASGTIPFTEQIFLGGDRPLSGFREGRLIDRSAVAARFSYTWPVWVFLDGAIHYAVGNVFGEHLQGFSFDLLRQSVGIGLRSSMRRAHAFELLVATGTETFRQGAMPQDFRFVFGATSGF